MKLFVIAAMSKNRVIGKDNKLPWDLPEDLKRFKELTLNKTVIMGRKTFDSIGKPLPNRDNIVLSRSNINIDGVQVAASIEKALEFANPDKDVFIIGGQNIYEQTMELVDYIYLTVVNSTIEGDAYFPEFSMSNFVEKEKEENHSNPSFTYYLYQKKA